jgi:hypothetical protein
MGSKSFVVAAGLGRSYTRAMWKPVLSGGFAAVGGRISDLRRAAMVVSVEI